MAAQETIWDQDIAGPGTSTEWDAGIAGPGTRTRWDYLPEYIGRIVRVVWQGIRRRVIW